ncbi:MAG: hypothetical protein U1F76_26440 [Candidatus Competibacteraceae bacterium]
MHAIRFIETVSENGRLELQLDKPAGTRVEVIVLDLEPTPLTVKPGDDALALAKLQEETGFAGTVLASTAEDVWNEL